MSSFDENRERIEHDSDIHGYNFSNEEMDAAAEFVTGLDIDFGQEMTAMHNYLALERAFPDMPEYELEELISAHADDPEFWEYYEDAGDVLDRIYYHND